MTSRLLAMSCIAAVASCGSAYGFTRPGTAPEPNSSDDVIVTKFVYDSAGRVKDTIDNKAIVSRSEFDAMGRVTKLTENYIDGTPGDDNDRITLYTYNAEEQKGSRNKRGRGKKGVGILYCKKTPDPFS